MGGQACQFGDRQLPRDFARRQSLLMITPLVYRATIDTNCIDDGHVQLCQCRLGVFIGELKME